MIRDTELQNTTDPAIAYSECYAQVFLGDCLEIMPQIESNSIDMILCDLPYEVTQNDADIMIEPTKLWKQYWRIAKPNAAVVLFGQDKFTAKMMLSDKNHKYNLIWDKVLTSGFLNANRMPLRSHEDIIKVHKKDETPNFKYQAFITALQATHLFTLIMKSINSGVTKFEGYEK